jgi:UDP-N-acetylglucosamine transferase subunit ALG13
LILCIFGTHPQPFDRALDLVIDASGHEELIVQHGSTPKRDIPSRVRWHELVPFGELVELIKTADAVVCHGGVGSLMTVLDQGRRPIAIARRRGFGEHVDDHQLQIVEELGARGYLVPCAEPQDLREALRSRPPAASRARECDGTLWRAAILAAGGTDRRAFPARRGRLEVSANGGHEDPFAPGELVLAEPAGALSTP